MRQLITSGVYFTEVFPSQKLPTHKIQKVKKAVTKMSGKRMMIWSLKVIREVDETYISERDCVPLHKNSIHKYNAKIEAKRLRQNQDFGYICCRNVRPEKVHINYQPVYICKYMYHYRPIWSHNEQMGAMNTACDVH